ncbi:MAG: hypothetical protein ACREC5_01090 [Thermoplasmata archaeon]
MRPTVPLSVHRPLSGILDAAPAHEEPSEEPRFRDRPCYAFNRTLAPGYDDRFCSHCRHYLTARCPHIEEFLDDVDELGPE